MIPTKMFFTNGVGRHKERLASFEIALRDAGIEKCNLVNVSSILPPRCKIIPRKEGEKLLTPGQITFCVLARSETNEPNRLLSASIGCAIPAEESQYGYLSEHHSFGETEKKAGDYAEDLAAEMLASTLGVEFDPNSSYDEKREIWKISDKIVKTRSATQSAIADKDGRCTSAVAAAVFIIEEPGIPIAPDNGNKNDLSQNVPAQTALAVATPTAPPQTVPKPASNGNGNSQH